MTLDVDITETYQTDQATFKIDLSFTVSQNETVVLLGPSGSGKTLLLETIAGFRGSNNEISIAGTPVATKPPEERNIGFVFQEFALFPHLTVQENIEFGTQFHTETTDANDLLDTLNIAHLAERMPSTLSGGEQQRVAIARALAIQPQLFLFDEPLSSLDIPTQKEVRNLLIDILEHRTAVYVTHDRSIAQAFADRIGVIRNGEIVQIGSPDMIFDQPSTQFVASFTGNNVFTYSDEYPSPLQKKITENTTKSIREGMCFTLRPEYININTDNTDITCTVSHCIREESGYRVNLKWEGHDFEALTQEKCEAGSTVDVEFQADNMHFLDI